ncbi:MAG: superoxide dismutase [Candidatus Diapherotrites archaeon CG10_big_fil_rev_8_21_14_0_10_31_34]|nr:MAG: superoxide dismutase [Candidatus Diapherotrites archaeon CG10_big_fil_rev_8_21_14_0_10_31_34]
MKHELMKLSYAFDALEPFIDRQTMETHHSKHHQAYVNKLNTALEGKEILQKKTLEELISDLDSVPVEIRTAVRNNGGGVINHNFFWPMLKKEVKFEGEISEIIIQSYGSFEKFKEQFSDAALTLFGSGWVWLVLDKGELKIIQTYNQDSPLTSGKIPLLTLDVWEHAYYLKYKNKRADYIEAFFNVINWKQVNRHYLAAKK